MPQTNNITNIFTKLHSRQPLANLIQYLFFFGTDAKFTPKPTAPEKSYVRGELFSYISQAITKLLGEAGTIRTTSAQDAVAFSSPSVVTLNGPSTLGSNVGERIAQGVLLALEAVASGKKVLQFSGHSRGAVETILVLHELARIKDELEKFPNKLLNDILLNSPCKDTRAALQKLVSTHADEDTVENRKLLLASLKEVKTHAVLIDAVPGDMAGIGWHDPRFYQTLPCDKYQYFVCRDERTQGFYPIIAEGMDVIVIPGHHGSALGNIFSQAYAELPTDLQHQTSSVQDLVLCKWFHFVNHATGAFSQNTPEFTPLNLEHEALDTILNNYLTADSLSRNQILLDHYIKVAEDDPAYRYFERTHYPLMPTAAAAGKYRYVHLHNSRFTSAYDAFPDIRSTANALPDFTLTSAGDDTVIVNVAQRTPFVNLDHVKLYLDRHLSDNQTKESDEKVVALVALLDNLLESMRKAASKRVLEATPAEHELITIMSNEPDRELFFQAVSVFVESINNNYLSEQTTGKESAGLFSLLSLPYSLLAAAQDEDFPPEYNNILMQLEDILQNGLRQAIETNVNLIMRQTDELLQEVDAFLKPEQGRPSATQPNIESELLLIEQLHNKLEWVQQNYSPLSALVGRKTIDLHLEDQQVKCDRLVQVAAAMLINSRHDLRRKPADLGLEFYQKVTSQIPTTSSYVTSLLNAPISAARYVGSFFSLSPATKGTQKSADSTPTLN